MQSSMVVAGIDALSESCENILTRRANQRHYSIIAQFVKRPWPCPTTCKTPVALPDNGLFGAFAGKNPYRQLKLHRLATAKGRLSRCRAARTSDARARGRSTRPVPSPVSPASGPTGRLCGRSKMRSSLHDTDVTCASASARQGHKSYPGIAGSVEFLSSLSGEF